jgi:HSP20 family protein
MDRNHQTLIETCCTDHEADRSRVAALTMRGSDPISYIRGELIMLMLRNGLFDVWNRDLAELGDQTVNPESKFYAFTPDVESYQKGNSLVLRMAIPGVDPKDVDVSVQGGYISIKTERQRPADVLEEQWYLRGFSYGRSERTWLLPESVDGDKIEASFKNGVLEIRMPAAEKVLPKKIEVKNLELAA